VAQAAARLARHRAALAPVVSAGRAVGLLTEDAARAAARTLPGGVTAAEVAWKPAPAVSVDASPAALWRAARGTAPGVLVRGRAGSLRGVIRREEIDRRVARARNTARAPAWLEEPDAVGRLDRLLDRDTRALLDRAAALATRRRLALYVVGGIVRDIMRGEPGRDPDLVVEGDAMAFARILGEDLGLQVVTHAAFGTAELRLAAGGHVDVITARREWYPEPGALPCVEPSHLGDDLRRRDVTINAMAIRLDGPRRGRLRDDMNGLRDLRARRLRVHHALSLVDDPTRAFRIARLAARLRFSLAEESLRSLDLARGAGAHRRVSGTRLWREFGRVMSEPDPHAALDAMARLHLLEWLGPGLSWGPAPRAAARRFLARRGRAAGTTDAAVDGALVLLGILSMGAARAAKQALAERLSLRGRSAAWLLHAEADVRTLERALLQAARASVAAGACDRRHPATLALAASWGSAATRRTLGRVAALRRRPGPLVSGETLRSLGLAPGPAFAAILARVRDAWLDGRVRDRAQAEALARRLVRRRALTPTGRR
jgi:tRNA nucleotidyltransferase (CCA-adding enzyme)